MFEDLYCKSPIDYPMSVYNIDLDVMGSLS